MPNDNQYKGVKDAKQNIKVEEIQPSTLETIDMAFYDFVDERMNNHATANEGWKKTPVVWVTSERSFLSKNNANLMDKDGALIFPLISIERTAMQKSLTRKGSYYGLSGDNLEPDRFGRITLARKIVKDKTNNYSVADSRKKYDNVNRRPGRQSYYPKKENKKVVYETLSMPMPIYVDMTYSVSIRTEYVQQMNQLLAPFITLGGGISYFVVKKDGHRYETFLKEDLSQENNVSSMGTDERTYMTNLTFEVLGYIIGESPNGDRPRLIKKENAVKVKLGREKVIFGDIPEYGGGSADEGSFYRD
tara:strand:- start:233 stop:1144 length:912 start_codon:yes stop_codon:yes gene_type:complete